MRILVLSAFLALALSGCGGGSDDDGNTVVYRVGGTTAAASLTYRNETGGTVQSTVTPPRTITLQNVKNGDFLFISAQKEGAEGSVSVSINVGDRVLSSATSTAAFGIATASKSCCD